MSPPSPSPQPRIMIAGAGIGGLSAALSLHAAGFRDVHVFEAAATLASLGVGINVQPSAVLVLRNLGLLPALLGPRVGAIETRELNYYNRHGNPIVSEPRGRHAGYAVPQLSVHRGALQMLLLAAVRRRLGAANVHLGHALHSWEQEEDGGGGVTAHFVRRARAGDQPSDTQQQQHHEPVAIPSMTGAVLVAADGINSTARRILYPDEGAPRFSGRVLWRGCTERAPFLTGASMVWAGHADQKFIAYPIARSTASPPSSANDDEQQQQQQEEQLALVNWIAELRVRDAADPDRTPPATDWTRAVDKAVFAQRFAGWRCGGLDLVADLVAPAQRVFEFPMCDRDPVARWSFGRVTLLGDAAHPMYPIGSNGATQAIIDGEALARCLVEGGGGDDDGVRAALAAYEAARLPPTARIVLANRANGPDHVLQLAEERAPDGFEHVFDVVPREELEAVGAAYKALAGFERDSVNRRAGETAHLAARWADDDVQVE